MTDRPATPPNAVDRGGISPDAYCRAGKNPNNGGVGKAARPTSQWEDFSGDQSRRRRSDSGSIPQPRRRAHHVIAGIGMVAGMGSLGAAEDQQPAGSGF